MVYDFDPRGGGGPPPPPSDPLEVPTWGPPHVPLRYPLGYLMRYHFKKLIELYRRALKHHFMYILIQLGSLQITIFWYGLYEWGTLKLPS